MTTIQFLHNSKLLEQIEVYDWEVDQRKNLYRTVGYTAPNNRHFNVDNIAERTFGEKTFCYIYLQ